MNRWIVLFAASTVSIAHAEDLNNNDCDDAFEANGGCVAESATVDASTTVGMSSNVLESATVGAQLAIGSNVTIGARAFVAGRVAHVQNPLPVGDNVVVGRGATIGIDASLATDTDIGRTVMAGERLTTGAGTTIGYATTIGDDVTIGSSAVIGNLSHLGTHADIGNGAVIARSVTVADADAPEDGAQVDGVVGSDTQVAVRALIASGARVRKQATIGEGAMILGTARVGRGATVGIGATVEGRVRTNAVVLPLGVVEAGATVQRGATVCAGATVPTGESVASVYPPTGCASTFPSCLAAYEADNSATDGIYSLDPDGAGPDPAFDAYCDMANGGWTLAMRTADSGNTFTFLSTHWTTASTLGATSLDPTTNSDGKFPAFNEVEGQEIRGCLRNIGTGVYGCKEYDLPASQTLLEMFTNTPIGSRNSSKGYFFTETHTERLEWLSIWGRTTGEFSSGSGINYSDTGINIDDDQSNFRARVRFGLALNNEADITTLNDTVGFGASAYHTSSTGGLAESAWRVSGGAAFGDTMVRTRGHIWVR